MMNHQQPPQDLDSVGLIERSPTFSKEQLTDRAELVEDTYIQLGMLLQQSPYKKTESIRGIAEDRGGDSAADGAVEIMVTTTFVYDAKNNIFEIIETVEPGMQPNISLRYVRPITSLGSSAHVLKERIDFTRSSMEPRTATRKILHSPDRVSLEEKRTPVRLEELEELKSKLDPSVVSFKSADEVAERLAGPASDSQKVAKGGLRRILQRNKK